MTIEPIDDIALKSWGQGTPGRSTGLHLSDIIKALLRETQPERFSSDKPMDVLKVELGFAYERVLERGLQEKFPGWHRPQEFHRDGIACSPDGISFDADGMPVVEELKCTWMSLRDAPLHNKFWHWLVQIKAYCYVVNTFRARLRALFINGNYSRVEGDPESGPQFRCWALEFNARELAENWQMLTAFAKHKGMLK